VVNLLVLIASLAGSVIAGIAHLYTKVEAYFDAKEDDVDDSPGANKEGNKVCIQFDFCGPGNHCQLKSRQQ
jgi:hypothetical protein